MDAASREALWRQFGAAIEMLENSIQACPDALWGDRSRKPEFWYLVFHTLFFLDLYLSQSEEGFQPPPPFTCSELDPTGILPERSYTKAEILDYLEHGRAKCRAALGALSVERAAEVRRFGSIEGDVLELLLYNMRHVQHHVGQLHLILRQETDFAPSWVGKAGTPLDDA